MESICVLSDIHGNLAALEAVLERLDELGVKKIFSLGDTVGYGPQPVECLRIARSKFEVMLMGNHEYAASTKDWACFNPVAAQAISWTRDQLVDAGEIDSLKNLPSSVHKGAALYVHGSVHDPIHDYVLEKDRSGLSSFDAVAGDLEKEFKGFNLCFVGHNHQPFLCTQEGFIHPHDDFREFQITGEKLYVCVGSVGQPRDGDPRSCFVIYDGERVTYHRVTYPVEVTSQLILDSALPDYLAKRIVVGR